MKKINLVGQRFGKLLVVSEDFTKNRTAWLCKCDCGGETIALTTNLRKGNTVACGCRRKETLKTHGRCKHSCYVHWRSMKQRCLNKNSSDYENYGGRGIRICKEWLDVEQFISDMGIPPTKKHTLERINVNSDYKPSNCKWATRKEQANNKRNTIHTNNIRSFCEKHKLPYGAVYQRFMNGWSVERILSTPILKKYKKGQKCSVKGCNNPVKTRGMCNKHYLRWWQK